MELLDVEFRAFPHPTPENRAAVLVHFQHMFLRLLRGKPNTLWKTIVT